MTGKKNVRSVDETTLNNLAEFFQKEVTSLIDLYLKDSEKLLTKLKSHVEQNELKHIQRVAKELRQCSLDIGALRFSFIVLAFEIAIGEHRLKAWENAIKNIEVQYSYVVDELSTLRYAHSTPAIT